MIEGRQDASRSSDDALPRSRQERVEAHSVGRSIISALVVVILVSMIVSNLPPSEVRRGAMRATKPVLDLAALHQNWNLFAPNPRRVTLQLVARLTYADGSTEIWSPPRGGAVIGVYRTFRWRKWSGYVLNRSNANGLWAHAAAWLAQTHTRGGRVVTHVELIRRSYLAPPPGTGGDRPQWNEETLARLRVTRKGSA